MPKVSVIVPFYNVEEYIEKCLESLINQTLEDIEIIIVNDGSKDNSINIVKRYKEKYTEKITYIEKENGGLSDARNYGMPYAKGEYIAFLDSDDYVELDMYEKMYEKAEEENADMVECDFYWEYLNKMKADIGEIYGSRYEMLVRARVVAWNKLIKKSILDEIKIEFPKGLRYEDIEFFYKLVPYLNKVSFVKEPFIHYIQRDNSISNSQDERTKEIFEVLDNVIDYYKEKGLYEEYKKELEYTYTRLILCSSLLRMVKIRDKNIRKGLLNKTYENINTKFPSWRNNKILKSNNTLKNLYMRSINKFTFKIYCVIFHYI